MARWITKTVGGKEVLRIREGQQFTWADITRPQDFISVHSDEQLEALGFTVVEVDDGDAPIPPPMPLIASRLQFFRALAKRELITQQEALAAVTVNAIPAAIQAAIDGLPEDQRFDAEMTVAGAAEFDSDHPLNAAIGAHLMSPAEIRDFYAFAKTL